MAEDLRLRCADDGPDCEGDVGLRDPVGVPRPMPRCDHHWQQRLEAQRRFEALYNTQVASGNLPAAHEDPLAASAT